MQQSVEHYLPAPSIRMVNYECWVGGKVGVVCHINQLLIPSSHVLRLSILVEKINNTIVNINAQNFTENLTRLTTNRLF